MTHKVYLQDPTLWGKARACAERQGLSLSKVVALLLKAYVEGEIVVNAPQVGGRP